MPIAILITSCILSWVEGLSHILRCGYDTGVIPDGSHSDDIVLVCGNKPLWKEPYHSQVQINFTTYPSEGTLEIYLNNQWGNICYSNFNQKTADSACRQLGYTNAERITGTTTQSTSIVWLNDVTCSSTSCQCLNFCYKATQLAESCDNNEYVDSKCTFDTSIADKVTSGNEDLCANPESEYCTQFPDKRGEIMAAAVVVVRYPCSFSHSCNCHSGHLSVCAILLSSKKA